MRAKQIVCGVVASLLMVPGVALAAAPSDGGAVIQAVLIYSCEVCEAVFPAWMCAVMVCI